MQKSTVGGILSIVAGALGLLWGLVSLLLTLFASSLFNDTTLINGTTRSDPQFVTIITAVYATTAVFGLVTGVLGITGGVFSMQRKRWGWALAGSIAACLSFLPIGVGAVVLVAMSRSEFVTVTPVVPPQAPLNMPA